MTLTAEVTLTFVFEYDGTNEDLLVQLVKEMRKVADKTETGDED
jgi:hypothetical protein